jgi:hypothetical protein
LFKVKRRSNIVWKELIKLHKNENWKFGLYENERYLLTTFSTDEDVALQFMYEITDDSLVFRARVLFEFDEELTNDVMVLSSHFNSLLNNGSVRVDIKNNRVDFVNQGDLLTYMLYPTKIHHDLDRHFRITSDCFWAFRHMVSSGEEPVFVIAELIRRNNIKAGGDS